MPTIGAEPPGALLDDDRLWARVVLDEDAMQAVEAVRGGGGRADGDGGAPPRAGEEGGAEAARARGASDGDDERRPRGGRPLLFTVGRAWLRSPLVRAHGPVTCAVFTRLPSGRLA